MERFDIAVIGAGIAGASIAAELAPYGSVVLAEGEDAPGYHTTGRSAAFWEECYGGPDIVPLTLASGPVLRDGGFLTQRGALYIAREGDEAAVAAFMARFAGTGADITMVAHEAMAALVPGLRAGWSHAVSEPNCADIDVAALHQHYLARARQGGAVLRARHRLGAAVHEGDGWRLDFGAAGVLRAGVVVNAAGAWADDVAQMCGARPIGIQPLRRTVVQMRTDPPAPASLPLVLDLAGGFYFKPEAGRLWLSPHDETPSPPCDAAPDEMDVALAIERFSGVVDWQIAAVERKWAGLRSFAPDRRPVYGYDVRVPGFFWCAGQGGFGIQTAPAGAKLAAQVLCNLAPTVMTSGLNLALYGPERFG